MENKFKFCGCKENECRLFEGKEFNFEEELCMKDECMCECDWSKEFEEEDSLFGEIKFNEDSIDKLIKDKEREEVAKKLVLFLGGIAVGAVLYKSHKNKGTNLPLNTQELKNQFKNVLDKVPQSDISVSSLSSKLEDLSKKDLGNKADEKLLQLTKLLLDNLLLPVGSKVAKKSDDLLIKLGEGDSFERSDKNFNNLFELNDDKDFNKKVKSVIKSEVSKSISTLNKSIKEDLEKLKDMNNDDYKYTSFVEVSKDFTHLLKELMNIIKEETNTLSEKLTSQKENYTNLSDEDKEKFKSNLRSEVEQSVTTKVDNASSFLKERLNQAKNQQNVSSKDNKDVDLNVKESTDKVKEEVKETKENVKQEVEDLTKKVKEEVKETKENVKQDVKKSTDNAKKEVKETKENVKQDVKEDAKENSENNNKELDLEKLVEEFDKHNSEPKLDENK